MRQIALVGLAVLLLISVASAQSVGPPRFTEGDEWRVSGGTVVRVVRVDGDTSVITGVPPCVTCLIHRDKNLTWTSIEQADGRRVDPLAFVSLPSGLPIGWKFFEFPLAINRTWNFSATNSIRGVARRVAVTCTVDAYEDVSTKAGTFKAFRIRRDVREQEMAGGRVETWTTTVWYAPDVKAVVKLTNSRGRSPQWEMVSYSVK